MIFFVLLNSCNPPFSVYRIILKEYKEFFQLFGIEQAASTLTALIYSSVMVTVSSIGGVFAVFRLFRKHKNAVK